MANTAVWRCYLVVLFCDDILNSSLIVSAEISDTSERRKCTMFDNIPGFSEGACTQHRYLRPS